MPVLGGSGVLISRVISRVTILITHIRGLITPLITTPEPPSKPSKKLFRGLRSHGEQRVRGAGGGGHAQETSGFWGLGFGFRLPGLGVGLVASQAIIRSHKKVGPLCWKGDIIGEP